MTLPVEETKIWDDIHTSVFPDVQKDLVDNVYRSTPLLATVRARGMVEERSGLNERLLKPVLYQENELTSHYSGDDILSTQGSKLATMAAFDWKEVATPVRITRIDQRKNAGRERIFDLFRAYLEQARMAMATELNKVALKFTPNANEPDGPQVFVHPDNTSSKTIGGIDQSDTNDKGDTWWTPHVVQSSASTYAALLLEFEDVLTRTEIWAQASKVKEALVDPETWKVLVGAAQNVQQLNKPGAGTEADLGFDTIRYRGVNFFFDSFVGDAENTAVAPASGFGRTKGTVLFINWDFMGMAVDSATNFQLFGPVRPINQDIQVGQLITYYTWWVTNRRKHGLLKNVDLTISS